MVHDNHPPFRDPVIGPYAFLLRRADTNMRLVLVYQGYAELSADSVLLEDIAMQPEELYGS